MMHAESWMHYVVPGDLLTPQPEFNASERPENRLPVPVRILAVRSNARGCQSGIMYAVRTTGGVRHELDAAWFMPLVYLLEQEPLGAEFEAVWDANRETLYEP